jgi:general secretion pathway protein H
MIRKARAYTLVELTVVVFLIGLMLALAIPRMQHSILRDDLKAATRRMVGAVRQMRDMAVRDQKVYRLHLDMESSEYWVEWDPMTLEEQEEARKRASSLPGDIRFLDVYLRGLGKKQMGEAVIHFTRKGYMEQAVIHLGVNQERAHTLVLSPFVGTVKTHDKYVDITTM